MNLKSSEIELYRSMVSSNMISADWFMKNIMKFSNRSDIRRFKIKNILDGR